MEAVGMKDEDVCRCSEWAGCTVMTQIQSVSEVKERTMLPVLPIPFLDAWTSQNTINMMERVYLPQGDETDYACVPGPHSSSIGS